MKIQCFMPVFNEADILPHTIRHMHEQGVSVHIIDGWSADYSYSIAQAMADSGERFPAATPDPIQNCTAILERIEELAAKSDADWILYSDADEWRRSPVNGETLADAVRRIDHAGFNAIDFQVLQFYCTDGSWTPDLDPEKHFRYYNETDCISLIPNRKLWKNVGQVKLNGGGHEVMFPGIRVYPQRFLMKHYPFRTPEQARRKIETRLQRRRMEEHAKGWGVHYDQFGPDSTYLWNPEDLKEWPR